MDGMDTTGKTQSGKPDTPAENREPEKTDRRKKRKEKKDRPPREPKYGKLPRLFRKTYKEKKFRKRILKFLRLPADREFVDGLFAREEKTTPKGKTLVFRRVPDAAHIPLQDCKRLKKLGKAVKKQRHGRVRLLYIALVFAAFAAILCVIGLFRNRIARAAVTAAMQGIFGAKCDIGRIDLDIFHTRFTIEDLAVADKNEPMKNLFEVGRFDLYFNLLELTRGKLVSENMELTGVTWGTVRETSGALPEKEKKDPDDPDETGESFSFREAASSAAQALNLDAGMAALADQYDPRKILEREIASLRTPPLLQDIRREVPALITKWQGQYESVMEITDTTMEDIERIRSIPFDEIDSAEEVAGLLVTVREISERTKNTVNTTAAIAESLQTDAGTVQRLGEEAQAAVQADTAYLAGVADRITDFDLDAGKNLISGVLETFFRGMLDEYYPLVQRGVSLMQEMQNSRDEKKAEEERELSLEERSSLLERLPGRTFTFGRSAPALWLKNIALSCGNEALAFSGGGSVTNITSDADQLGLPASVQLDVAKDAFQAGISGTLDFRSAAAETARLDFTADGTEISVPSGGITGVPALDSPAVISGSLGIAPDGGTTVETGMDLSSVVFTLEPFEPEFLYSLYGGVLSGITDFSVDMRASVSPDWHLDLDVSTDADEAVASAVRSQATALVSRVKERVREESSAYLASLTEQYSGEIQAFTSAVAGIQERFRSLEDIDTLVQERLEELEEKAKVYAAEKAAEALAPVQDAVESAVQDALDKLPVPVPSGGGTTEDKGESAGRLLDGLRKLF